MTKPLGLSLGTAAVRTLIAGLAMALLLAPAEADATAVRAGIPRIAVVAAFALELATLSGEIGKGAQSVGWSSPPAFWRSGAWCCS